MKPVTLPPKPQTGDTASHLAWLGNCVNALAQASQQADTNQVFDSYSSDSAPTATRQVSVTSPSTQNLAAVLATLINDIRARGVKSTGPT